MRKARFLLSLMVILLTLSTHELVEKGDKYLQMADSPVGILKEDQAIYAKKAQAYYSRALLEMQKDKWMIKK